MRGHKGEGNNSADKLAREACEVDTIDDCKELLKQEFRPVLFEDNNNKQPVRTAPSRVEPSSKRARTENSNIKASPDPEPQRKVYVKAVPRRRKTNRKMPSARRTSNFTPFIFDPKASTKNYNFSTERTFVYRGLNSYSDLL